MALFCNLCNKKIGIFDGYHSPADVLICDKCYAAYENVLDSMDDAEDFQIKIIELKLTYAQSESIQKITEYLAALYNAKSAEAEQQAALQAEQAAQEEEMEQKRQELTTRQAEAYERKNNLNIGPFHDRDLVYTIEGVRGRHIDIYKNKAVITTNVTIGSILSHNATDGEKTVYYSDCIGVQFKQSGFTIGYLQLETASSAANNKDSNFFNENTFTFDETVISNERMVEVADYIKSRVDAIKTQPSPAEATPAGGISVADELLKLKQLLDMGVLTQGEFDAQKNKLLNQ